MNLSDIILFNGETRGWTCCYCSREYYKHDIHTLHQCLMNMRQDIQDLAVDKADKQYRQVFVIETIAEIKSLVKE